MTNGKQGKIMINKSHKKLTIVIHVKKPKIRKLFYKLDLLIILILLPVEIRVGFATLFFKTEASVIHFIINKMKQLYVCVCVCTCVFL